MIGAMKPVCGPVAVAHDGKNTLAMLRKQPHESLHRLLLRLDAAIETAQASGQRVDEINKPSADKSYEPCAGRAE